MSVIECRICMESTSEDGDPFVNTPCGHIFHANCIRSWLIQLKGSTSKRHCPTCRKVVNPENLVKLHVDPTPRDLNLKIVVVGDSQTGKTCLIHQFANHHFTPCQPTTIGLDMVCKTVKVGGKVVNLNIWDTAGQEKFFSITNMYMRGADGVFIVYDVVNTRSLETVPKWFDFVRKNVREGVPIILIGNKADLKTPEVSTKIGKAIAQSWGIRHLETSAKENDNVEVAFKLLAIEALLNMEEARAEADLKPAITLNPVASQHERRSNCC